MIGIDPAPLQGWQIMELAKGSCPEVFDTNGKSGRGVERHPITKQTISMLKVFVDVNRSNMGS
jgi:hypothetical protein